MLRFLGRLKRDESAAVAATVALSLFGLIAVGGIAFDYARMATLDTELQNAAEQAALAGVTQLDGLPGAMTRARNAAQTLLTNNTRLANDSEDSKIGIEVNVLTAGNGPATDATAARVRVDVKPRRVFYALTPIVGLLDSGDMNARALAGLQSAICNVPPLYMAFDRSAGSSAQLTPGTGVLMLGAESASHFGYLDTGSTKIKEAMAWDDQEGKCQSIGGVLVKTGVNAVIKRGFNTRFANGTGNGSCPQGGTCSTAAITKTYPRDSCHATGNTPKMPVSPCTSIIGDGAWPDKAGSQTRYQKYRQELLTSGFVDDDRRRLTIAVIPFGSFGSGSSGSPVTPTKWLDVFITEPISGVGSGGGGNGGNGNGGNGKAGGNGGGNDPADTANKEGLQFYIEIIGVSSSNTSGRRDVPYLLE